MSFTRRLTLACLLVASVAGASASAWAAGKLEKCELEIVARQLEKYYGPPRSISTPPPPPHGAIEAPSPTAPPPSQLEAPPSDQLALVDPEALARRAERARQFEQFRKRLADRKKNKQKLIELRNQYEALAWDHDWSPAPGKFRPILGFTPENPESLVGRSIRGYHEHSATEFGGRVLWISQDPGPAGAVRAFIATGPDTREVVKISGAENLLVFNEPQGAYERSTPYTQARIALAAAQALPIHDSRTMGPLPIQRTPDGTILVPRGICEIDGRIVHTPASAYHPPPPGMAETIGLAQASKEGYRIIRPLATGGTRHVYLVEKAGRRYALKIMDPDRMFPLESKSYPGADEFDFDWRHNPARTPHLESQWRARGEGTASRVANREKALGHDIGKYGFNPLTDLASEQLAVNGVQVYEMAGEMTLGEALAKHPELAHDPQVLKRLHALSRVDHSYSINMNWRHYDMPMGYIDSTKQAKNLGIDMKPDAYSEPWDNTRVNLEVVNGKVRIKEAFDVDW